MYHLSNNMTNSVTAVQHYVSGWLVRFVPGMKRIQVCRVAHIGDRRAWLADGRASATNTSLTDALISLDRVRGES